MDRIIQKASELLKRCQTVTFATVNGEGFPRPVPVKTLRTDDALTIWFATGIDSEKVAHIRRNMRTGASFYDRDDSVSLIGHAEVVTDPETLRDMWQPWLEAHFPGGPSDANYCLIKFTPGEGAFYLGGEFVKFRLA